MRLENKENQNEKKINQPLSLKNNSIWNLFGSMMYALTQWGILIAIAKLGSPEMVGIFTLALAITAPMVLLFRFNLRSVVVSDSEEEYTFNDYYTLRIISTVVFVISIAIITLFYLPNWEIIMIIIIFSLSRAIESVSDILHGQMQRYGRLDITAKSRIIKGLISLIVFVSAMYITESLIISISAYFLSWLIVLIIYDYPKASQFTVIKYNYNKKIMKNLFKLSIPLGIAQLISSLSGNIPRYILEYFEGPVVLGFYGSIMVIIAAGDNFVTAISAAVLPRLSKLYYNKELIKYLKLVLKFMILIIIASLIVIISVKLYGEEILTIIYTPEYGLYGEEFFYFAIFGFIIYSNKMFETALVSTRVFKIQPYINVCSLTIIILFSIYLIPKIGLMGALYSLMIGKIVELIIRIISLTYLLKKSMNNK